MRKNILLFVIALILAIGLNGCSPGEPGAITINPDSVTINLASGIFTAEATVKITDESNIPIRVEADDLVWEIADTDVATLVAQKGSSVTIEAKKVGEAKLTVKYGNLNPAEITVAVIDEELMPASGVKAPKVAEPLVLGEAWPVDEKNAYSAFDGDAGWKLWVFWDDENVYIQYDVYTDYPFGNKKTERYIFEADSLEWEIQTVGAGIRQKWMVALTEAKGYEVVVRYPERLYYVAPNEYHDVLIEETEFGYRGQVILSQKHEPLAEFNIGLGTRLEMAVQVNDSKDGEERTRILGGFVDSLTYTDLWFMYK